jgi:hypothetical protein
MPQSGEADLSDPLKNRNKTDIQGSAARLLGEQMDQLGWVDHLMQQCLAWAFTVEVLTAYSHSTQAADLRLCHTMTLNSPVRAPRSDANHPWSLRDRFTETDIAELITAYRNGATADSLAATHGVSLSSVKRLLHTAGIRRTPPIRRPTTTTPVATNR